MLVFAGHATRKVETLSYEFISWVFKKTIQVVNRLAREALN